MKRLHFTLARVVPIIAAGARIVGDLAKLADGATAAELEQLEQDILLLKTLIADLKNHAE